MAEYRADGVANGQQATCWLVPAKGYVYAVNDRVRDDGSLADLKHL